MRVVGLPRSFYHIARLRPSAEGRSPKLNGCVERAQRTHQEEFYEVYNGDLEFLPLNRALQLKGGPSWPGSTPIITSGPIRPWTAGPRQSILKNAIRRWLQPSNCLICSGRVHEIDF